MRLVWKVGASLPVLVVLLAATAFFGNTPQVFAAPPVEFDKAALVTGLNEPTAFRFFPGGQYMLVAERSGAIKRVRVSDWSVSATPFLQLATDWADERGVLGLEIDPSFNTNGFVYVAYTTTASIYRLSRFTSFNGGTTADPASELVLLTDTSPAYITYHGGDIHVGPDGKVWWTNGENDTALNSQDLTNLNGKIHRVNRDGSIPKDNPFYDQPGASKSIWAYGLRNPFRFDFLPTGKPLVGDVGSKYWEEANVIEKGANYGWPLVEGVCDGCPYANPVFAYSHSGGGASITAVALYSASAFPPQYNGVVFYGDYARNYIRYLVFDTNYQTVVSDNAFDPDAGPVVDMLVGPDGALYYASIFPGALYRIAPSGGNRSPVVQISANPLAGLAPLQVAFASAGTFDPDGDPITYHWVFGDGGASTAQDPSHTYQTNGTYTAALTVSDGSKSSSRSLTITVGNRFPAPTITAPAQGSEYNAGNTISFSGTATDPEDGTLPASAFTWTIVFHHNTHIHPFDTPITGAKSGSFTISSGAHNDATTWYEVQLTVTDSGGLQRMASVNIYPNLINLTIRATVPGTRFTVDGVPYTADLVEQAVVGVKRVVDAPSPQYLGTTKYRYIDWSDGGTQSHTITTPSSDATYTVRYLGPQPPPPSPWAHQDIGNPGVPGSAEYSNGLFIVEGSGADIWRDVDQFQYVYQALDGDGEIIARIISQDYTHAWAKAGVMIREQPQAGSKYAMMMVTPGFGYNFQYYWNGNVSGGSYTFPNAWVRLVRSGNTLTGYVSSNGTSWTKVAATTLTMASRVTVGLAVTSHKNTLAGSAYFDNVSVNGQVTPPPTGLPSPWQDVDVGSPSLAGSATYNAGVFTVNGSGADVWLGTDQFHYVYQPLAGDGQITARVTSQTNTHAWAKAGVIIKESTAAGSPYAAMLVTPGNGLRFQYYYNGSVGGGAYSFPNAWVRIVRSGNTLTAYASANGTSWTQVGSATVTMGTNVTVGLLVTSHNAGTLGTATFDNAQVAAGGGPPPPPPPDLPSPWLHQDVGAPALAGSAAYNSGVFTVNGAGTDIWRDQDQFHYVYQTLNGDGEIFARVTSETNTHAWAKAGVIIKETTSAGSRYAVMAVTPGNGYSFQYWYAKSVSGGAYAFPNAWVRLVRSGSTITAYISANGTSWTQVGSTDLALAANVTVGLFVTSHNAGTMSTATFDNVTVTP